MYAFGFEVGADGRAARFGFAPRGVAYGVKVGGHLAREQLDVARAEQRYGRPLVADGLERVSLPPVPRAAVEVDEFETVGKHEHISGVIPPAAERRYGVADGAGVGVRPQTRG